RAARVAAPGIRLRAYACSTNWHLTSISGRPQLIRPPITVVRFDPFAGGGLDKRRRGERDYSADGLIYRQPYQRTGSFPDGSGAGKSKNRSRGRYGPL
ncbi:hypothetical protein ACFQ07_22445, partial [Actinomadura adrarensis]